MNLKIKKKKKLSLDPKIESQEQPTQKVIDSPIVPKTLEPQVVSRPHVFTGAPPKYKSPLAMQKMIDNYFATTNSNALTITGLTLHLGFCDRQSFYSYERRKKFCYTIKTARHRIENFYEKKLLELKNSAGPIFALKNVGGWVDKQEIEQKTDLRLNGIIRLPAKKQVGAPVEANDNDNEPGSGIH